MTSASPHPPRPVDDRHRARVPRACRLSQRRRRGRVHRAAVRAEPRSRPRARLEPGHAAGRGLHGFSVGDRSAPARWRSACRASAFAQRLSVAAGLATLALTYVIGRRLMAWPPTVALVPCALLAVCGPFATWSSSGMESTLFGLLILLAAYQLRASSGATAESTVGVAGALALLLSTLTRPEGMLIAAPPPRPQRGRRAGRRRAIAWHRWRSPTIGLLPPAFGIYFAWRFSRYGYVMPNTFYAKTGGGRAADPARRPARLSLPDAVRAAAGAGGARGGVGDGRAVGSAPLRGMRPSEWFRRSSFIVFAAS